MLHDWGEEQNNNHGNKMCYTKDHGPSSSGTPSTDLCKTKNVGCVTMKV